MVTRQDYNKKMVEAARTVMLELAHILGEYRDSIAIVGGWVPPLILPEAKEPHVGSTDVDIALDHKIIQEPGYERIRRKLEKRGYRQDDDQPYIFYREVSRDGETIKVKVDLLAGEYEGTGRSRRHQKIQDVRARKARGCDLVFSIADGEEIIISGIRPDGYQDSVRIKVAGVVSFLVMKSMALADREKEKDAYDIYFVLKNYPGGIDRLVDKFLPHASNRLVREGLEKIAEKFASPQHIGPGFLADFEAETDPGERELLRRDAFEQVNSFLRKLGIISDEIENNSGSGIQSSRERAGDQNQAHNKRQ